MNRKCVDNDEEKEGQRFVWEEVGTQKKKQNESGKIQKTKKKKKVKNVQNSGKEKRHRYVQFMINLKSLILPFILLSGPLPKHKGTI